MLLAFAFPFLPLLVASFSFRWHWPALLPTQWLWDARETTPFPVGWDYLFSPISGLGPAFLNTVVIGVVTALLAVVLSLPAARVLARYTFRGKGVVEFFLLVPVIVPQIAVGMGMLLLFMRIGIARTYVGIILAHLVPAIPYAVRILTSVFQNLDPRYEEQARTLGSGWLSTFRRIVLPMVLPGVTTAFLFSFLISANIFLLTFLISGGRLQTLPTMLFSHIESGAPLDATTAGLVLIVSVPGLVFLMISDWLTGDHAALGRTSFGSRSKKERP
ncbi:MAG: ABC transporter permease [Spirochaetaceae bacterium]|nr:MAG: ABC transporter permease [Spirochaetaceae bacterium]